MYKVINEETTEHIEVWNLPSMDGDALEAADSPIPMPQLPTAEDILAMQENAYHEAFERGTQEGNHAGFEEGLKQGIDKGIEQGFEQGLAQAQSKVEQLITLLNVIAAPLAAVDQEVEQELAHLAIAIAKHIVRRELKIEPEQVIAVIKETIALLPMAARDVKVYLHPADSTLVNEMMSINDSVANEDRRWRIIDDPALTRGGCNIETENSRIDATVETRLAVVIAQALGGERHTDCQSSELIAEPVLPPVNAIESTSETIPESSLESIEVQTFDADVAND